jgi:fructokinase
VTRIGQDAAGDEVLAAMAEWSMDPAGVQFDPEAPTGRVLVTLDDDGPSFEIGTDQAFDNLQAGAVADAIGGQDPALLYHGSLIARTESSLQALSSVRDLSAAPVFLDINLRDPWWNPSGVDSLLHNASWLKLNNVELATITGDGLPAAGPETERTAGDVARRYGLRQVVVTCGEDGAIFWADGRVMAGRPPMAVEVLDTVGAGDAFSAVWIAGLTRGWPAETILVRALEFAAAICGIRGATTEDRRIYDRHLASWETT